MASTARLYSGEVLALATRLSDWPLDPSLSLIGAARSPACGSTLTIGLHTDDLGRIDRIGLRAQACAIGQAAAAVFAGAAPGKDRRAIAAALAQLEQWLGGGDAMPAWPGLETIAPARDFPGRHGAMLLAWRAALEALPSA